MPVTDTLTVNGKARWSSRTYLEPKIDLVPNTPLPHAQSRETSLQSKQSCPYKIKQIKMHPIQTAVIDNRWDAAIIEEIALTLLCPASLGNMK